MQVDGACSNNLPVRCSPDESIPVLPLLPDQVTPRMEGHVWTDNEQDCQQLPGNLHSRRNSTRTNHIDTLCSPSIKPDSSMNRLSIGLFALRIILIGLGEHWNQDVTSAILPGLHCWYCSVGNAPYGLLWYIVDFPLSFTGGTGYILSVFALDGLALSTVKNQNLRIIYWICSFWIGLQAPYDAPILWFALLGLVRWPLTFLAPLAKIPDNLPALHYVLSEPHPASDYQYYALMGVVFISVLITRLRCSK